ncbi:MAG: methionine--tRNA ligase, partial [Aquihabitans sp.]
MPGRHFLTTPIYYVNDVPHIGHAYTTVTADALARWHRLVGDEVFFLTGTDEHGLKIARAAAENGVSPQEHVDTVSTRFQETWALLDIVPDRFIRTTDPDHHVAVQAFLQKIYDNGHIYKSSYAGWYCVACEAYYGDDELLPNPDGEIGLCPVHIRPAEWFEEENWFFRLSAFEQPLLDWYAANPHAVAPDGKRNEALGLIKHGLRDISITRTSIDWGVTVPWDEDHVFYVWYDALINYATAVGYGTDPERFATWWPHVRHLLGKDILRFHCVYWPAMLLAAGEAPPAHLNVHGYLLVGGEKMSKTRLNQIFPADLVADFGVDGFRYHLLRDTGFGPDGDFSYEGMAGRYNADLANNFGNLLSRVATVVAKKCDGTGPAPRAASPLIDAAATAVREATVAWDAVQPSVALEATWRLIREANAMLEDAEPWKAEPGPEVDGVLGDALEVLRLVSILASPALTRGS